MCHYKSYLYVFSTLINRLYCIKDVIFLLERFSSIFSRLKCNWIITHFHFIYSSSWFCKETSFYKSHTGFVVDHIYCIPLHKSKNCLTVLQYPDQVKRMVYIHLEFYVKCFQIRYR